MVWFNLGSVSGVTHESEKAFLPLLRLAPSIGIV